jgi:hypothetical protein
MSRCHGVDVELAGFFQKKFGEFEQHLFVIYVEYGYHRFFPAD